MNTALFHGDLVTASRRKDLSSFLFFTILAGSGTLEYDGGVYPLSQGDCVFLDCRKPYSHCCSDELWTLKWVHFYGPNMNGIYKKYAARGGRPCFHPGSPERFSQVLTELPEAPHRLQQAESAGCQGLSGSALSGKDHSGSAGRTFLHQ